MSRIRRLAYKHLGFTGSKDQITDEQIDSLQRELKRFRDSGYLWMHNGDCVTSDLAAANIWRKLKGKVMLHPPINDAYRAHFPADIVCEPRQYLHRDHHIVECSKIMIATPRTFGEQTRSGTWTTVRYARQLRVRTIIIFPDGTLSDD